MLNIVLVILMFGCNCWLCLLMLLSTPLLLSCNLMLDGIVAEMSDLLMMGASLLDIWNACCWSWALVFLLKLWLFSWFCWNIIFAPIGQSICGSSSWMSFVGSFIVIPAFTDFAEQLIVSVIINANLNDVVFILDSWVGHFERRIFFDIWKRSEFLCVGASFFLFCELFLPLIFGMFVNMVVTNQKKHSMMSVSKFWGNFDFWFWCGTIQKVEFRTFYSPVWFASFFAH